MAEGKRCEQCGAELAADAPEGLCPQCLLKEGMRTTAAAGESGGPTPPAGGFVPPEPEKIAELFPQLEILELLGRGGMGVVYKARQPRLDRLVALKVLPPDIGADPAFAERFAREARSMARLNHPNIVTVYDFGQAGELYYFIMEYVDGVNLRQMELTERLSPEQALTIVPRICEALQYAHDEGIVHRDIKPENILIDQKGRVKITDFGLAKLLARTPADFTLTQPQQVMGTPHYMAPEQVEHPAEVDHRADIYSLGVVFYEMLTGELPIGRFAPPSRKVQVDVRLDEVVLHTLEKEPERRYQQASEVKTDVETIAGAPRPARAAPPAGPPPAPPRAEPPPVPGAAPRPAPAPPRAAGAEADEGRRRWLGQVRAGALLLAAGLIGFILLELLGIPLLGRLAFAGYVMLILLRMLPAAAWVVGAWLFTQPPRDGPGGPIAPICRQVARFGFVAALGLYVVYVLLSLLVGGPAFTIAPSLASGLVWAVLQFALFRYAARLWRMLGRKSLAAQAAVLTWVFPLVLALGGLAAVAMGLGVFLGLGMPPQWLLIATSLLRWPALAAGVWAAAVLLTYALAKAAGQAGAGAAASLAAGEGAEADHVRRARRQVRGPAIGLLVVGILNAAMPILLLLPLAYRALGPTPASPPDPSERFAPVPEGIWRVAELPGGAAGAAGAPAGGDACGLSAWQSPRALPAAAPLAVRAGVGMSLIGVLVLLLGLFVHLPMTILIIVGALKMMKLQSYGLAMLASILAMLPCSPALLIGLPIGIWAIVVLGKPEVKAAFGRA